MMTVARQDQDDISLIDFGRAMLEERRLVARIATAIAGLVAIVTLLLPRTFTATAAFVPAGTDQLASRASSLAAQFGFALPTGGGGQSPDFYAEFLQSQSVLGTLAFDTTTFTAGSWLPWGTDDTLGGTVAALLGVEEDSPGATRDQSIRSLRDLIEVQVSPLSGMVILRVKTVYAGLSQFIAARMLALVNDFNRSQRQTQAKAEREFAETRAGQARVELRAAEDAFRVFLQRNRSYQSSPALQFEADRLQREVAQQQQLSGTLDDSYEAARLTEVRNTPVISIVQSPVRPGLPDRRYLIIKTLVAFLLGVGMGGTIVIVRNSLSGGAGAKQTSEGDIQTLWQATLADLRRPWRLVA